MSCSTLELRGMVLWNLFKPCSKNSFPDRSKAVLFCEFCYLCIVLVMLSCLFIAASWAAAWKWLTSWFSCMWIFCVLSIFHVVPLVKRILIYDICLLTFFHLATHCVQSIPDDNTCEGLRQYIDKEKEQKVYRFGECCNQSNIVPLNSCYEFWLK